MMSSFVLLFILLFLVFLILAFFFLYRNNSINFKISLEVEVGKEKEIGSKIKEAEGRDEKGAGAVEKGKDTDTAGEGNVKNGDRGVEGRIGYSREEMANYTEGFGRFAVYSGSDEKCEFCPGKQSGTGEFNEKKRKKINFW